MQSNFSLFLLLFPLLHDLSCHIPHQKMAGLVQEPPFLKLTESGLFWFYHISISKHFRNDEIIRNNNSLKDREHNQGHICGMLQSRAPVSACLSPDLSCLYSPHQTVKMVSLDLEESNSLGEIQKQKLKPMLNLFYFLCS